MSVIMGTVTVADYDALIAAGYEVEIREKLWVEQTLGANASSLLRQGEKFCTILLPKVSVASILLGKEIIIVKGDESGSVGGASKATGKGPPGSGNKDDLQSGPRLRLTE